MNKFLQHHLLPMNETNNNVKNSKFSKEPHLKLLPLLQ